MLAVAMGLALMAAQPAQLDAAARVATPEAAAADFVAAFNRLDEARFDAAWAEDATVFWPGVLPDGSTRRIDGRANVLARFHAMFARLRASRSGPDYLDIRPHDLRVQRYGDTAIITFHLGPEASTNRRTLVMRRQGRTWRIVHLHGSHPVPATQ